MFERVSGCFFFHFILSLSLSLLSFLLLHCLSLNSKSTWKICKIWEEIWSDLALCKGLWILVGLLLFYFNKYKTSSLFPSLISLPTRLKPNQTNPKLKPKPTYITKKKKQKKRTKKKKTQLNSLAIGIFGSSSSYCSCIFFLSLFLCNGNGSYRVTIPCFGC